MRDKVWLSNLGGTRVLIRFAAALLLLFPAASQTQEGTVAAQEAEDGVYDSFLVLGQSAAFTGPAAALGAELRRGAVLFFDQVNTAGGVHGRSVFLLSLDDGYEPDRTLRNTRKLIEQDRVFALFGYVGTPTSKIALPLATRAGVPFFAPYTGAELLRSPFNRFVFNVRASYFQETAALVDYLVARELTDVAVFHQDDSYGRAGLDGVKRALERNGLSIGATGTVQRNTTDVAQAVERIAAADPDAVVMISAYRSCGEFIRQAKAAGFDGPFLNVSFVGSKSLAMDLWLDARGVVVSQVVPFPADESIPVVKEYNDALRVAGQHGDVSYGSLEGFIAAKVFVEGLQRAGRELTRERFMSTLEGLGPLDLGGFALEWGPDGHPGSEFVGIAVIGDRDRWLY
jgi:ABC-type branched-subunit amino acid transport system substrate-binding protein